MAFVRINRFSVGGYKAFPSAPPLQVCELAPLTLVIGYNSAGKSVLVRSPVLVADSLGDEARLLSLDSRGLDLGHGFTDIVHGGSQRGTVAFGLDVETSGCQLSLDIEICGIQARARRPAPIVGRWRLSCLDQQDRLEGLPIEIELDLSGGPPYTHHATVGGRPAPDISQWDRLFPRTDWLMDVLLDLPSGGRATLAAVLALRDVGASVHHIAPFRATPRRQYDLSDLGPPSLGEDGCGAVEILAWDKVHDGNLIDRVSAWFKQHFSFGLDVSVEAGDSVGGLASLYAVSSSGARVNLADLGSGIAQVLPLVVRRFQLEGPSWSRALPTLQIIEQPELHLHPAANAVVGDLLIDMASKGTMQILAETHSENLVLRVRRRVAEGLIDPTQVALYWIDNEDATSATVRRMEIESDGWVEGWPDGVFSEDSEESRALARAMRGRDE